MSLTIRQQADQLFKARNKIKQDIEDLQKSCPHTNKKHIDSWNDHDGYSQIKVNWYYTYKCPDCDKYWYEEQ